MLPLIEPVYRYGMANKETFKLKLRQKLRRALIMNENFWIDVERSRTLLRNILTFAQLNAYPFTYKFIFLRYEDEREKDTL